MKAILSRLFAAILTLSLASRSLQSFAAEIEVDLALVLAVDVSRSMDDDEQRLQRAGYVEAFKSNAVHDAIGRGMLGRIAVIYMEWSGANEQKVVLPWMVVDIPERATEFAQGRRKLQLGASSPLPSQVPLITA